MMSPLPAVISAEYQLLNYVEAGVWGVVAIVCLLPQLRVGWSRPQRWLAAITLVLFGISDLVEAQTGAWWQPWWLLVWKAACIALMLALIVVTIRRKHQETPDP